MQGTSEEVLVQENSGEEEGQVKGYVGPLQGKRHWAHLHQFPEFEAKYTQTQKQLNIHESYNFLKICTNNESGLYDISIHLYS